MLMVHVADNGMSFELPFQPSVSVDVVQSYLASLTGIPVQDQMLISKDTRLEAHRTLLSYKLPSEIIFLFNRSRLVTDCPCPPPEEFVPIRAAIPPPPPAVIGSHPLNEGSDPALMALPLYELQFGYHYEKGQVIGHVSQLKFDACRRLLREQQVQELALETARGNIDYYYKVFDNSYQEFFKQYNRQSKYHSELLANLDRDLDRLRSCKLHPGLRNEHYRTLLDCVKEAKIRKWAEDCSISFKQFNTKVFDLKNVYAELQRKLETLFYSAPAVNIRELADTIDKHVQYTEEQASIIQSLSKDVETVKKLINDCINRQYSSSVRPHDAVSALGPMFDVHDKSHLPRMEACEQELSKLLLYCQKSKNAMSRSVHTRLQSVATLQSNLKDMRNQLAIYKEAMTRQEEVFTALRIVRRMGSAYKSCLLEVVRRKATMKLYMGQAGQLAEKLARKREAEVARREEFLRQQSVYFTRDILEAMGLFEYPSHCGVNIAPFDMNLLDIDIGDVEFWAPESLVGPLLKLSGSDTGRGGSGRLLQRSPSDSAFQGGSDNAQAAREGSDAEGDDEGSSDEIAGTSKLEVENAWLKAELASAVAKLCYLDHDLELEEAGDTDDLNSDSRQHTSSSAVRKVAEALRLKDDYAKHLHEMQAIRQSQINSYEKRIRELEHRLSNQHLQMQKLATNPQIVQQSLARRDQVAESQTSSITGVGRHSGVPDPMDEGVTSRATFQAHRLSQSISDGEDTEIAGRQNTRSREGVDETMSDLSGGVVSTSETATGEYPKDAAAADVDLQKILRSSPGQNMVAYVNPLLDDQPVVEMGAVAGSKTKTGANINVVVHASEGLLRGKDDKIAVLQNALAEKSKQFMSMEEKVKASLSEVVGLRGELDNNAELLTECQMNCAHLENRLHEAREEARTNLCAADRRATEYNALRASSVRLRGLMERLRSCISNSAGSGFAESLRTLAISLSSASPSDSGENTEFCTSIRILAERVGSLVQQRTELLERCTVLETSQSNVTKDLESKTELLRTLYAKRKNEKQASKEMICYTLFQVHGLAVFIPDARGHYEALNRNCPHYYLSDESVALFLENLPSGQHCIVGQIVHIDRNIARAANGASDGELIGSSQPTSSSCSRPGCNPYDLPTGTEYFVVTVAMVPDFSPPSVGF